MKMVGIVGYGGYVPKYRIRVEEIAKVWNVDGERISKALQVEEKSVPSLDEDTATIAVAAARKALEHSQLEPEDLGAIYIGSESHPYVVKPTATIVAAALNATPEITGADLEFACKAGTAGLQACMGLVKAGYIKYGLAIGADTSQGRPGDMLEYTASAGGAAFVVGETNTIADIIDTVSYSTDTPDFWRREGQDFPRHGRRFTGQPAYFKHVINAATLIMERNDLEAKDFTYVVLHQPNGKFPRKAAKLLGFTSKQLEVGLLSPVIGNTYSGASLLGLVKVLDKAEPGDLILMVSYGSGAGSDAFIIEVNGNIKSRPNPYPLAEIIENKEYVSYATYAKFKGKLSGVALEQ